MDRAPITAIVHEMLEQGGWTHQQIADEVRRRIPYAQTTAKSVASLAMHWRRERQQEPRASVPRRPSPPPEKAPRTPAVVPSLAAVGTVIQRARAAALDYQALTGRPLGVTGEIGEFEAARLLGLELAPAREAGWDAKDATGRRLQIKTRRLDDEANRRSQRVGGIKLDYPFEAVLLVLLVGRLEPTSIWEADRAAVLQALTMPGSKARNERGALAVSQFRAIARQVWPGSGS